MLFSIVEIMYKVLLDKLATFRSDIECRLKPEFPRQFAVHGITAIWPWNGTPSFTMRCLGPRGILYYVGIGFSVLISASIFIFLVVNLILWATFYQANVLLVLSNVFYGIGMLLALGLLLLCYYGSGLRFSIFLKRSPCKATILSLCALRSDRRDVPDPAGPADSLLLTCLMVPVWVFIIIYWANDFDELSVATLGSVSTDSVSLLVRAPGAVSVPVSISVVATTTGVLRRSLQVPVELTQAAVRTPAILLVLFLLSCPGYSIQSRLYHLFEVPSAFS